MSDDKPIIVVKKKGGHGGHHGGAWKVAYADFVTAMMAFFMVMWLVNSAETNTKQHIASYFRRPGLFQEGSGSPLMIGEAGILQDAYVPPHPFDMRTSTGKGQKQLEALSGSSSDDAEKLIDIQGNDGAEGLIKELEQGKGYNVEITPEDTEASGIEESKLDEISKKLKKKKIEKSQGGDLDQKTFTKTDGDSTQKSIERLKQERAAKLKGKVKEIKEQLKDISGIETLLGKVEVRVDSDGVLIEIMDNAKQSMFKSGSAIIEPSAQSAFAKVATVVNKSSNEIDIIGHTDASPFPSKRGGYSNWELSADRANAARRILELEGVESKRITSVIGRADKEPKVPKEPLSPSNRRITLKLKFNQKDLANTQPVVEEKEDELDIFKLQDDASKRWKKKKAEEEKVNPDNPKDIVRGTKLKKKRGVKLPENKPSKDNPSPPPFKDLIFQESPVMGPRDIFGGN